MKNYNTKSVSFITALLIIFTSTLSFSDENEQSHIKLLRNSYSTIFSHLYRQDIDPGAIIASPSKYKPNYFYHWVRDAGLTMLEITNLYSLSLKPERKKLLDSLIVSWINFEIRNQRIAEENSSLGEPIFTVIGHIYPGEWGRPQNDGPAIRALAMIQYAFELIKQHRLTEARRLYQAELPAQSPIKKDLEYIAHHWKESNFDLWEEVKGDHFFTKMAQRAALLKGAQLAQFFNDPFAANFYKSEAQLLEPHILAHLNDTHGHIIPTINQTDGWKNKLYELDSSTLLAVIYFSLGDGFIDVNNPWVQKTAYKLESFFTNNYGINQKKYTDRVFYSLSPAIGRYPGDVYDGFSFSQGNPWFLTTNAFGEYYCLLSKLSVNASDKNAYLEKGLGFLNRSLFHSDTNGNMSEQFNRDSGYMQGAIQLTWSYVSYLRAYRACQSPEKYLTTILGLEL